MAFWHNRGYPEVKVRVVKLRSDKGLSMGFGLRSNLVQGLPPPTPTPDDRLTGVEPDDIPFGDSP
jgi:hypothetical protein